MFKRIVFSLVAVVMLFVAFTQSPAQAGGGGGGGGGSETRLIARASQGNNGLTVKSEYRERVRNSRTQQRFKVEIERATPGATYAISINGVMFGTITANSFGRAEIEFHSFTFARIRIGDTVTVGPLTGTYANR